MANLYFSLHFLVTQCILHLISVNNSNKDGFLNRKKFVMFRIGSIIIILSLPFLFNNYGIPIVISSLITGICGFNIVYDKKYHSNHGNKL